MSIKESSSCSNQIFNKYPPYIDTSKHNLLRLSLGTLMVIVMIAGWTLFTYGLLQGNANYVPEVWNSYEIMAFASLPSMFLTLSILAPIFAYFDHKVSLAQKSDLEKGHLLNS